MTSSRLLASLLVIGSLPALLAARACGSLEPEAALAGAGGGATTAGGAGGSPAGGAGGSPACLREGSGGNDLLACDYVTVDFSTSAPVSGLAIGVATSDGDHLELGAPDPAAWGSEPTIMLTLSTDQLQALGFRIVRGAGYPHFSPASLAVAVHLEGVVIGDGVIAPTYACVALSSDDRCLMGAPETLTITLP